MVKVKGLLGLLVVPLSAEGTSFLGQLAGAATLFIWAFGASFAVWWLLKRFFGLRISAEDEYQGADISECGMEAYPEFSNKA